MKKSIFTLLAFMLLLSFSCDPEETLNPNPGDELPPETMHQAGTFGCLIDGVVWNAYVENDLLGFEDLEATYDTGWHEYDNLRIQAKRRVEKEGIDQLITLGVSDPKIGQNIINTASSIRDFNQCSNFYIDTTDVYTLTLTKLDLENKIAAGTFEFTVWSEECNEKMVITSGRFDAFLSVQ